MRAVTTSTAAVVLGVQRKALDNILNRLGGQVIPRGRQGVERRIPVTILSELLLAIEISAHLGAPIRETFALAKRLSAGETDLGPFLRVWADFDSLRAVLDQHLELAIESVVRRPRGRPPRL